MIDFIIKLANLNIYKNFYFKILTNPHKFLHYLLKGE